MAPLFRLGLGGALGDGRQWMSWIHLHELAQLALFAIENLDVHGPLNASAPWPARNGDFGRGLAGRHSLSHGAAREAIAAAFHEGWFAVVSVPTRVRSTRPPTMPTSPSAGWSHRKNSQSPVLQTCSARLGLPIFQITEAHVPPITTRRAPAQRTRHRRGNPYRAEGPGGIGRSQEGCLGAAQERAEGRGT